MRAVAKLPMIAAAPALTALAADRVRLLRAASEATLRDPAFLDDAQKQNLPLDPVSGEEAENIVAAIYAASPDLAKQVKDVFE